MAGAAPRTPSGPLDWDALRLQCAGASASAQASWSRAIVAMSSARAILDASRRIRARTAVIQATGVPAPTWPPLVPAGANLDAFRWRLADGRTGQVVQGMVAARAASRERARGERPLEGHGRAAEDLSALLGDWGSTVPDPGD